MAEGATQTRLALVERCVLFYLIIVLRERNQARFESFSKIFKLFNAMWAVSPTSLFMACKERYNLCMNRASLDHESCIVN